MPNFHVDIYFLKKKFVVEDFHCLIEQKKLLVLLVNKDQRIKAKR